MPDAGVLLLNGDDAGVVLSIFAGGGSIVGSGDEGGDSGMGR